MNNDRQNPNTVTIGALRNSGTFADVYEGEFIDEKGLIHQAAIKILKKKWNQNEDLINRLEDEAFLLDRIHHDNIIKIFGLARIDDRPAIVMELVRGIDLSQALASKSVPSSVAFEIGSSVCKALDAAYRNKYLSEDQSLRVIHRDIKPANVMLNSRGIVKVLDFGASKFQAEARKGQTTQFQFGSPKYMPSERRAGNRGVHVSDVYSLGIMLIELLLNRPLSEAPPSDRMEHDEFINRCIDQIEFNLPNHAWTLRAKELLNRICAFDMDTRLSAKKCIPLLDAFAGQSKAEKSKPFYQSQLPRLIKDTKKSYGSGPLTGSLQELRKVNTSQMKRYDIENSQSSSILRSRIFWLSAAMSTLFTFMTLTLATDVLSNWSRPVQTENSLPEKSEKTTEPTVKPNSPREAELNIEMTPAHFKKVSILDNEGKEVLSLKRLSPNQTLKLPFGEYQIEAHILKTKNTNTKGSHITSSFELSRKAHISCKQTQKSRQFHCIDKEGDWSLNISCSKRKCKQAK